MCSEWDPETARVTPRERSTQGLLECQCSPYSGWSELTLLPEQKDLVWIGGNPHNSVSFNSGILLFTFICQWVRPLEADESVVREAVAQSFFNRSKFGSLQKLRDLDSSFIFTW